MTNDQDLEQRPTQPMSERPQFVPQDALTGTDFYPQKSDEKKNSPRFSVQNAGRLTGIFLSAAALHSEVRALMAQEPEPAPTAVASQDINLRSYPSTNDSDVESVLPANQEIALGGQATINNEVWFQVRSPGGEISWINGGVVSAEATNTLPDITNLFDMSVLDEQGNASESRLGELNVDLGKLQEKFQEMVSDYGMPVELFNQDNLHVIASSPNALILEQKNRIEIPDAQDPGRINVYEQGNVITFALGTEGEVANWGFWGVGQVADIANQNGAVVDVSTARFRPTGNDGSLALGDHDGGHAIFAWDEALANIQDANVPDTEKVSDAVIVAQQAFPLNVPISITANEITFPDGVVFTLQSNENDILTAVPSVIETGNENFRYFEQDGFRGVETMINGTPVTIETNIEGISITSVDPELFYNNVVKLASTPLFHGQPIVIRVMDKGDIQFGQGEVVSSEWDNIPGSQDVAWVPKYEENGKIMLDSYINRDLLEYLANDVIRENYVTYMNELYPENVSLPEDEYNAKLDEFINGFRSYYLQTSIYSGVYGAIFATTDMYRRSSGNLAQETESRIIVWGQDPEGKDKPDGMTITVNLSAFE